MTSSMLRTRDRGIYTVTAAMSGVLYLVLLIAPILTVKLDDSLGFSPTQIGMVFSFELGAFGLATVPAYLWLRRINVRTAAYGFALVVVLGNIVSGLVSEFEIFILVRVLVAFASGSITVIVLGLGGRSSNPARAFGLFVLAQCITGAAVLFMFPVVFTGLPISALYWTIAGLTAIVLPVIRLIDGNLLKAAETDQSSAGAAPRNLPKYLAGLAAVFFLFAAAGGLWAFYAVFADAAGITVEGASFSLSLATILGIAAPLTATLLGDRPKVRPYLVIGFLLLLISLGLILRLDSVVVFAISATLFSLGWNFLPAYLFAQVGAASGGSPHALSTTNLMVGLGFAVGPSAVGSLLEKPEGIFWALISGIAVLGLGLVCAVLSAVSNRAPALVAA